MKKALSAIGLGLALLSVPNNILQHNTEKGDIVRKERQDLEAMILTLKRDSLTPIFDQRTAKRFIDIGGTYDYAKSLADIRNKDSTSVFAANDMLDLRRRGIDIDYVKGLMSIRDKENSPIFSSLTIQWLWGKKGSVEYAKELASIRDKENKQIFHGGSIAMLQQFNGTVEYAKAFASIKNAEGNPLFNGWEIVELKKHSCTYEDAVTLLSLNKKRYNQFFTKEHLLKFKKADGTVPYAKELAALGFSAKSICNFQQIGISVTEAVIFNDTEKPNAVIILPISDKVGAFETEGSMKLFKAIKNNYDLWARVVSTEQEAYKAIDSIPNIETLVLAGHGTETTLSLGGGGLFEKGMKGERYKIDLTDNEFAKHLKKLDKDAVIFLFSCSNGQGGENAGNLANFITKLSAGRQVISSVTLLNGGEIVVDSIYPFDLRIVDSESGKDITYKNRGKI